MMTSFAKGGGGGGKKSSLLQGDSQQQQQQQSRSITTAFGPPTTPLSVTDSLKQITKSLNFLHLPQQKYNQKVFGDIFRADDDTKKKFIKMAGFVYQQGEKSLSLLPQGSMGKKSSRFHTKEKFTERHGRLLKLFSTYKDDLDIRNEHFANFLKDSIPEFDEMTTEFYDFLMFYFAYSWENYYDVGPWTVVTLQGLTDVDRRKCKERLEKKLFTYLKDLYWDVERFSEEFLTEIVKKILVLKVMMKQTEDENDESDAESDERDEWSTLNILNKEWYEIFKGFSIQKRQQQRLKLKKTITEILKDKTDGECIQLFLAFLRQFDLCKEVKEQHNILKWLLYFKDILFNTRTDEFLHYYRNWMLQRCFLRENYLTCEFPRLFNLNIKLTQQSLDIQLLRMNEKTFLKMWECFLYNLHLHPPSLSSSSSIPPIQMFLMEIFNVFYDALDIIKEDKGKSHYETVMNLFKGRLLQLADFFQHHPELFRFNGEQTSQREQTSQSQQTSQSSQIIHA